MFTGIVDHQGKILSIEFLEKTVRLRIQADFEDLSLGESVSVDGVCLTVVDRGPRYFICEVSEETLRRTVIKHYQENSTVNLERALRPMDRLGGHFVSGHVDQTLRVSRINSQDKFCEVTLEGVLDPHCQYLTEKGSIAINGVSLTINRAHGDSITFTLIPHTLMKTNLGHLQKGAEVNAEFDMLAKLVSQQTHSYLTSVESL